MKTRVTLIVVTICCVAEAFFSLVHVRERILNQQRSIQKQQASLAMAEIDLASLKIQLHQTTIALRQSQAAEKTAKREKETLRVESAAELTRVHPELDRASGQLIAQTSSITPEQLAKTGKQICDLQNRIEAYREENRVLRDVVQRVEMEKPYILYCPNFQPLPAELRGNVLTYDPKWNFVVLNVGREQGARPRAELLVSRNGKLIGWLVIDSVEKDRCIASVKPGWQLTEVLEGDTVMPAHPES